MLIKMYIYFVGLEPVLAKIENCGCEKHPDYEHPYGEKK
jgi:hypothetical protein